MPRQDLAAFRKELVVAFWLVTHAVDSCRSEGRRSEHPGFKRRCAMRRCLHGRMRFLLVNSLIFSP